MVAGAVIARAQAPARRPNAAAATAAPKAVAPAAPSEALSAAYARDVRPILDLCSHCHNDQTATAGLNIGPYYDVSSLVTERQGWERMLAKLRAGEMPPVYDEPVPDDEMAALIACVEGAFDEQDRALTVDPGHVPVHRLNRVEYENTVRDLLGVDFEATDEFPADDSGYGFDNIGDVLTVSPTLMAKYLSAAEAIASRAVGGDPLPAPGFFTRHDRVRHAGDEAIELNSVLEYDADYVVRVTVAGHRGQDDPPVTLVISVDGTPVKTSTIPVQISAVNKQAGATQRTVDEVRVFVPGNAHTFRAEFVNDDKYPHLDAHARTDAGQNIYPELIEVGGPYPPSAPHTVPKPALICDPSTGAACVTRILTSLAHRAYRRPAQPADVQALVRIYTKARTAGYTEPQSLQFAIAAMLVSPDFLFRIERQPPEGVIAHVSDVELASRLSYFLWSSMPDDELLTLGEENRLHQPAVLEAQVTRMLADPKSRALAENFAGQWLETRSLDAVTRDHDRFPQWTPELRDAMREETTRFFDAVLHDNRPVTDFIDGKYTFLNELLARHYGIRDVKGPEFRRVELTTDERSGVFTQASVLTVTSYPTRTSVVLRGKYLLENVLNAPPPPPPPDVPTLNESTVGVAQSLRTQMESHRADPLCASCHTKMDPLGFGLENYDAIGRWRTNDGKFPVDASGTFPDGQSFTGAAGMKALLLQSLPQFTSALATKMLTYALGRGVDPATYDRLVVRDLVANTAADQYRLQTLVRAIVRSVPFEEKRGPAAAHAVEEARSR